MLNERVKIVDEISQRDYTNEGQIERLKFVGKYGIVVKEHNSHGECYTVEFNGRTATYDPDEMIFVPF